MKLLFYIKVIIATLREAIVLFKIYNYIIITCLRNLIEDFLLLSTEITCETNKRKRTIKK